MAIHLATLFLAIFWFVMGLGVFNLWKRVMGGDAAILIIMAWPLVLIVTAIITKKSDT